MWTDKKHLYQSVLVIGCTGFLGRSLTRELLKNEENVTVLVKETSLDNPLVAEFKQKGASVLVGNLESESVLDQLQHFEAIICSMGGGVKTHSLVVKHAKNCKRIIPSSFTTMDPDDLPLGQNFMTDSHRDVYNLLVESKIPFSFIHNGIFYEYCTNDDFLGMNFPKGDATIYGDGNAKFSTTHTKDVAQFTVRILNDESKINKKIHVASKIATQNELCERFEKAGFQFEKKHVSEKELDAQIEKATNHYEKGILQFRKALFFMSESVQLKPVNAQDYPDVVIIEWDDYIEDLKPVKL
jgi:nucleoside-diphosphate-sugar epimerase